MQTNVTDPIITAVHDIDAPLVHKGKVRELYDLGDQYLIVVTDVVSAFDHILQPGIPNKGNVLNQLSAFWFQHTKHLIANHMVHTNIEALKGVCKDPKKYKDRIMVVQKAKRIDIECVVRGYITGNGWRQYEQTGQINGQTLPKGLRKNQKLDMPIFTPSMKRDEGHDEDISMKQLQEQVGEKMADVLMQWSIALYAFAANYCEQKGIVLADCKLEFGLIQDQLLLIDECFTPDSSRFWEKNKYKLDVEIESMDKEIIRTYLLEEAKWDRNSEPPTLSDEVVELASTKYVEILQKIVS
ncbi:phosphoribosylaminoimidazolesuccinocarboxamide synthase [Longirhabdus pacifica]|uniref:phosphoribosylaminoimidazolesuccinocarboxamide synthase n=1 Tax=Longirhabdus pacifica TaxID=2305227 RepID=UPI001F0BC268|nr:phosphoribosylaminoimidazolesuccinocarboxamide synthase [Longirhabdus pacifica]